MNSIIIKKSLSFIFAALIVTLLVFQWKSSQSSPGNNFIEYDSSKIKLTPPIQENPIDTLEGKIIQKKLRFDRPSKIQKKQNRSQWSEPNLHEIKYTPSKTNKSKKTKFL